MPLHILDRVSSALLFTKELLAFKTTRRKVLRVVAHVSHAPFVFVDVVAENHSSGRWVGAAKAFGRRRSDDRGRRCGNDGRRGRKGDGRDRYQA